MFTVIGCGNLNRSDDGVGVVVARRLMGSESVSQRRDVLVADAGTGGMDVMFRARGADKLVIVDANRSGTEPGAIYQVPGAELERNFERAYSLHDFRWDHALHMGRQIFGTNFPTDVTVFLIEVGQLGFGLELTEPVRCAANRVVKDIESMIADYAAT